jgi:hypothetical protein
MNLAICWRCSFRDLLTELIEPPDQLDQSVAMAPERRTAADDVLLLTQVPETTDPLRIIHLLFGVSEIAIHDLITVAIFSDHERVAPTRWPTDPDSLARILMELAIVEDHGLSPRFPRSRSTCPCRLLFFASRLFNSFAIRCAALSGWKILATSLPEGDSMIVQFQHGVALHL